ncbi:MAG: hypothetical protein V1755_10315 [Chloroflexota bacterium]
MKTLVDKKWIFVIPAFLGLGFTLLAVFAVQLGLDHNATWGGRRILALALGMSLSLSSLALRRARQHASCLADRGRKLPGLVSLGAGACALFVVAAYVWFISLGRWTVWPASSDYYDRLATAFRHGQLNIDTQLDPALAELPNPYDPDARRDIQGLGDIWDMSLYNGKIYLYFGAAPALVVAAVKSFYPGQIGDATLAFGFLSGLFVFESLLVWLIWRRFYADITGWTIVLGLLVIGLAHPVPWMLMRPRIYEAAIAAGQFFLVGGFYFALTGHCRHSPSIWWWVLAGSFWSLAVGTRATLVIPVVFLTIMVLHRMHRGTPEAAEARRFPRAFLAMTLPMVVGAILIGWHNWARFESILETGLRYQITMLDLNTAHGSILSPAHIPPNLYIYLINPPIMSDVFPFVRPIRAEDVIAYFSNHSPLVYNAERITGILYSTPFLLFAMIPAATALARRFQRKPAQANTEDIGAARGPLQWAVLSMFGSFALALMSLLLFFYGTVRYLLEITPFAVMLAMIGFWQGYRGLSKRPLLHAPYAIAAGGLATASIVVSVLLSFSSDPQWIRLNNPALLTHLILFFLKVSRRLGF